MAKRKSETVTARVTHLEMRHRPQKHLPVPTRPPIALLHAENMPLHYYRYLYEQVGKPHHWYNRRVMNDGELATILHSEATLIEVLYANGCPAGFFELDLTGRDEVVELAYFGLTPDYQGLGLGKWFLLSAVQRAWEYEPEKVTVHTNTLDHPAALGLYQQMGFEPVAVSEEVVCPWV